MKSTQIIWNPPTKLPRLFHQYKRVSYPSGRGVSHSVSMGIRRSKDVLMRSKHGKTNYRLGDDGWKDYPDSQAGKYKYFIGWYVIYDTHEGEEELKGWESAKGDLSDDMEWAYLPNCVAAGYTW